MNKLNIPKGTEAVLFDLDGTLVDSLSIWGDIDIEFLARFDLPVPKNLQKSIEGMSFTETAEYFKNNFEIPMTIEEIKDCWNDMAKEHYLHKVPLKDGVMPFLEALKEHEIPMGIASSNSMELVLTALNAHKIREYFDAITISCEVKQGKPSPDVYLLGAKKLGADPGHCVVFEDIPAGILAGKRAGMTVFAVEDTYSEGMREEKKNLADYFIESYEELELSSLSEL